MTYTGFIVTLITGWLFVYFLAVFAVILFGLAGINKEILYLFFHLFQLFFIFLVGYYLREYRDNFKKDFNSFFSEKKKNILLVIKYFIIYLLIFGLFVLLLSLLFYDKGIVPDFDSFSNIRVKSVLTGVFEFKVIFTINVFLMAPVIEELYFRFMLLSKLTEKVNFITAALLSSLFFSVFHFSSILLAFIDGLYLCYIYKKEGNIILNILVHSLLNVFSVVLLVLLI